MTHWVTRNRTFFETLAHVEMETEYYRFESGEQPNRIVELHEMRGGWAYLSFAIEGKDHTYISAKKEQAISAFCDAMFNRAWSVTLAVIRKGGKELAQLTDLMQRGALISGDDKRYEELLQIVSGKRSPIPRTLELLQSERKCARKDGKEIDVDHQLEMLSTLIADLDRKISPSEE